MKSDVTHARGIPRSIRPGTFIFRLRFREREDLCQRRRFFFFFFHLRDKTTADNNPRVMRPAAYRAFCRVMPSRYRLAASAGGNMHNPGVRSEVPSASGRETLASASSLSVSILRGGGGRDGRERRRSCLWRRAASRVRAFRQFAVPRGLHLLVYRGGGPPCE